MQRILVIGSCGAGKSTFSARLGQILHLPVIHLDTQYWKPNWIEPDKSEWRETVIEILRGDRWIIDGNYSGTLELRLAACDTVVFLDFSRYLCIYRVLKRAIRYRGKTRPDMASGCVEKIDLSFLKWTWSYRERSRDGVVAMLYESKEHVAIHHLKSRDEAEIFLLRQSNSNVSV
ncbi:MAG: DNA topology modulation protein [Pyrinomonadaceae bacterium]